MYQQPQSKLSSELQLIVYACQSKIDRDQIRQLVEHFCENDYQRIFALAQQHGLFPLLYRTLTSIPDIPLPSETLALYKRGYMSIVQYNMLMSAELTELMRLFAQNNVNALAFKGPVLAEMAYGDITLRQYGDLDILIRKEDLKRVLVLLQKRGYTPEIELNKQTKKVFFDCVNVIGLHRGSLRIEIHWELLSKNYAVDWEREKLWSVPEHLEINRRDITTLSFENHLLYLCVHGSKHLFERLEWICDIDRMLRTRTVINWEHLLTEARALGIERMVLLGLNLAHLFFNLALPQKVTMIIQGDPTVEKLTQKVIALHYMATEQDTPPHGSFKLLWQMREHTGDRLRFAYRALFAPKFDDFMFVVLPRPLFFLYPFIRPIRLLLKYFHR